MDFVGRSCRHACGLVGGSFIEATGATLRDGSVKPDGGVDGGDDRRSCGWEKRRQCDKTEEGFTDANGTGDGSSAVEQEFDGRCHGGTHAALRREQRAHGDGRCRSGRRGRSQGESPTPDTSSTT
jgi:hypothetical protein